LFFLGSVCEKGAVVYGAVIHHTFQLFLSR
jgi:hypothetical protein